MGECVAREKLSTERGSGRMGRRGGGEAWRWGGVAMGRRGKIARGECARREELSIEIDGMGEMRWNVEAGGACDEEDGEAGECRGMGRRADVGGWGGGR
ncbi:unnamed protein product, partial [Closterium sp. Naga37s-1]